MKANVAIAYLLVLAKYPCYAGITLCCLTPALLAQESASAPVAPTAAAPRYNVGDTWTFIQRQTDSRHGTPYVLTVAAVTEEQTTVASSWNGGPAEEIDWDNQGNTTRDAHGTTYEPSTGILKFPMAVGKSWDVHEVQRFTGGTLDVSSHEEVVAFERIQVAAGLFDAYKVSSGVNAKQLERLYSAPFTATYWYAPSVKRIVKSNYASYVNHAAQTKITELSAFSLAP